MSSDVSSQCSAGENECVLSQTQVFVPRTQPQLRNSLQLAHARLDSLTHPGLYYHFRVEQKELTIGRHPNCDITIEDKKVSRHHMKIYRDESCNYFAEEISKNGCFINDHCMHKGHTRAVKHGDLISLCVPFNQSDEEMKPFAAYIFRITDNKNILERINNFCDKREHKVVAEAPNAGNSIACALDQETVGTSVATSRELPQRASSFNHFVSETWVQKHWDMRTVLGRGNFSEVRIGVRVKDGIKLAVKITDKSKFSQFQNLRASHLKLRDEVEILKGLKHQSVVECYGLFETELHLYIIMELVSGGDLFHSILEDGCFVEKEAQRFFLLVCEAVSYLHFQNVVHRDLKPENVLLTSKDRKTMIPKIADFGLSRRIDGKLKELKTFCGTPQYFAPEVIRTFCDRETDLGEGYGCAVDVWSLGAILYVVLGGVMPFEEDGLYEQILEGRYTFDDEEWTCVTPEGIDLIQHLMMVNPKLRLTAQEALRHKWFYRQAESNDTPPRKRSRIKEMVSTELKDTPPMKRSCTCL